MKTSTDRILTTHVGSLPRPADLLAQLEAREVGRGFDAAAFDARLTGAVREIVHKQITAGIDSVCDGEQSKISYTFYVRHRLSGIGAGGGVDIAAPPQTAAHRDIADHPDFQERLRAARGGTSWFVAGPEKIHFDVQFTRYRADDSVIGSYRSLYIVTRRDGRWAIAARSSFAG
jgi:hypothetical protein